MAYNVVKQCIKGEFMNAKLTLYSDEVLIRRMKQYAKDNHTSVSKLVTGFFESFLQKEEPKEKKQSNEMCLEDAPITSSLLGCARSEEFDDRDYKEIRNEYWDKKYG